MKRESALFWIALASVLFFGLGILVGDGVVRNAMKHDAIQHGVAHYNSATGAFEWKEMHDE